MEFRIQVSAEEEYGIYSVDKYRIQDCQGLPYLSDMGQHIPYNKSLKIVLKKSGGYLTTVFCKMSVRGKYCVEFLLLEDGQKFLDDRSFRVQFSKLTL